MINFNRAPENLSRDSAFIAVSELHANHTYACIMYVKIVMIRYHGSDAYLNRLLY